MRPERHWNVSCSIVSKSSPLLAFLSGKLSPADLYDEAWSLLLAEARCAGVFSRLCLILGSDQLAKKCFPKGLRHHLESAEIEAAAFQRDVKRELIHLRDALERLGEPVLLLKGAAYVASGVRAALGRSFNDIDLLVPKGLIPAAESSLILAGWHVGSLDPYDDRYYREWSHEIPPMSHIRRGTTVDLHHALVMPTCRVRVDSGKMIASAMNIEGTDFWYRLSEEDMLLHAVAHLTLNSEFERGLRDLWDVDLLFREFSCSPCFEERLFERARDVGLLPLLLVGLYVARNLFSTPVSSKRVSDASWLLRTLFGSSASTRHQVSKPTAQPLSDVLLMYRELYLRLPLKLVVKHVIHKAKKSLDSKQDKENNRF